MASLEELTRMLNQAPCGIGLFVYEGNGIAPFLNDTYYQLIGYTREEYAALEKSPIKPLVYPEDLPLIDEQAQELASCGHTQGQYRIVRKDGDIRWIKLNSSLMEVDGQTMVFNTFMDITAEKTLATQFSLIAEHVGSSISILHIENGKETPVYTNNEFYRMLGVSREAYGQDPVGYNMRALSESDRCRVVEGVREAYRTGKSGAVEYEITRPDGSVISVYRKFSVLRQEKPGVYYLLSISSDVTARRESETQLAFEQARYRLILEQSNTAVFEWNYQTGAFYCSESYKKYAMSQADQQDILNNKGPIETVHPDDLPVLRHFFEMAGQPNVRHECILRLKMVDGSYRWSRMFGQQNMDAHGKPVRAIGAIMDISADMEKDAIIKELVAALPGGVALLKFGPRIEALYLSDALVRMGSCTHAEFTAMLQSDNPISHLIAPMDQEKVQQEVLAKARRGEPIDLTFRYKKNSVEIDWLHITGAKVREEDGFPVYYTVFTIFSQEGSLYKQIINHTTDPILVTEQPTGRIILANAAFHALFSMPQGRLPIGAVYTECLPEKEAAMLETVFTQTAALGKYETTLATANDKHLHVRAREMEWNGISSCILQFSDQTKSEKQLAQMRKLVDNVPGGIGIFEVRDGQIFEAYMNDGFYALVEDTRANRLAYCGTQTLETVHPEDRERFQVMLTRLAQSGTQGEIRYRSRSGRGAYVWLRMLAKVQHENEGTYIYCSFYNVDEQMKTQAALTHERTMLQLAMQDAKLESWEYDPASHQITFNQPIKGESCASFLFSAPESLIASGYIHPESLETYRRLIQTHSTQENPTVQGDLRLRSETDSEYAWKRIILTALFDPEGHYTKTLGTAMDITAQKEQEGQYRKHLMELTSADAKNLVCKGCFHLERNAPEYGVAYNEYGVPNAENISYTDFVKFLSETAALSETQQEIAERFSRPSLTRALAAGNTSFSMEYQRIKDGHPNIWIQTQCKLSYDPDTNGTVVFIYSYDITQQKTVQEMVDAVVRLDYDYLALLNCPTGEYVTYAKQEPGDSPLPPFHTSHYEEEVAAYARKYLPPEQAERNIHDMSIANIKAQLEKQPVFCSYANIRKEDGSTSRKKLQFSYLDRMNEQVLITCVDITDIYMREQRRISQLKNAMEAANAANTAKTEFLSRMSHDLRTPMNAIIGLTNLAQDEREDPAAIEQYLSDIHSAGKYLLELVNDCLDLEKISNNKIELHLAPYTYPEFRHNIETIIGPLCEKKHMHFLLPHRPSACTILTDRMRFEQIFVNLLNNAVKFTPEGGTISFDVQRRVLSGEMLSCDFVVKDTGIGMSEEFQSRMFEPFEQESNKILPQSEGSGLGLSIVKKLVVMMHGTITVHSKKGEGSEFVIHLDLPVCSAEQAAQQASVQIDASLLAGKHILLAEDHPLNTQIAKKLLEKKDMTVTCAVNGQEAIEQFQASPPFAFDAILMDIRMPVMNGLEAASAIRALPRKDAAAVPILAMTANAFDEDVQATLAAGMNEHLSKPIEPTTLYGALAKWFTRKREP